MSTLDQLRNGLGQAWQSLAEGWHEFSQHTGQALTRFRPAKQDKETDSLLELTSPWGLLATEIEDEKKHLIIKIEVPGMDTDDFDIQLVKDTLWVRGEKHLQRSREQASYHLMECAYGQFERAIPMPCKVSDAKAEAKYKKGVLRIKLEKISGKQINKIDVGSN